MDVEWGGDWDDVVGGGCEGVWSGVGWIWGSMSGKEGDGIGYREGACWDGDVLWSPGPGLGPGPLRGQGPDSVGV